MASAADAPQIATAPPVSVPKALPSFSARASAMPHDDGERRPRPRPAATVLQPSASTCVDA